MTLAVPSFVAGTSDEKLNTPDIYTLEKSTSLPFIDDLKGFFSGDFNLKEMFGKASSFIKTNLPLIKSVIKNGREIMKKGSLASRLGAAGNLFNTGMGALPESMTSGIKSFIKENEKAFAVLGDVTKRIDGTNLKDIRSLGNLVNAVAQKNDLFKVDDKSSMVGICSGLVTECTRNGIPNSFGELSKVLGSSELVRDLAKQVLPESIKIGDIDLIKDISKVIPQDVGKYVTKDVVQQFLSNVKIPKSLKKNDLKETFDSMKTSFSKMDSTWKRIARDISNNKTKEVINGTSIIKANEDGKKLISVGIINSDKTEDQMMAVGLIHPSISVDESLFKMYPTMALGQYRRNQPEVTLPNNEVTTSHQVNNGVLVTGGNGDLFGTKNKAYITIDGVVEKDNSGIINIDPNIENVVTGSELWGKE